MKVCGSARPITDSVGFPDTRRQVSTCGEMTRKSWARQKLFTEFSGIELVWSQQKGSFTAKCPANNQDSFFVILVGEGH